MSFNLERALDDLAEAGAARRNADDDALAARVGTMSSKIRRRRALRHAGTTVVAACAVGALALGVTYLPGILGDGRTGPAAPSSDPAPVPTTEPTPEPGPDATLAPLDLAQVCGVPLSELEAAGQLTHYSETGESDEPDTADAGFAEVLGLTEDANGAAAELEYYLPSGASLLELGWTLLLLDADGVIVGAVETGLNPAVSPEGATSTGTVTSLPEALCATSEPLPPNTYDLVAVAEAHGTRATGTPYLERTAALTYPVELGGIDPNPEDPFGDVFTCNAPGPDSIHTLPDPGGLTLAVDLPAGPWPSTALPQIPGFVGSTGGQTIIANLPLGVGGALVDSTGTVVGFVLPDASDVMLAELTPDTTTELVSDQVVVLCGPDGSLGSAGGAEGTYIMWPFVTATLKEVTDADGNAESSSETVIVIANPQEVTFTR